LLPEKQFEIVVATLPGTLERARAGQVRLCRFASILHRDFNSI
jgi:hypothetical protein